MLGDGLLELATTKAEAAKVEADRLQKEAAQQRAAAPTQPTAPPPAPAPTPADDPATKIYTVADKAVTPPVDIDRQLPTWTPSNAQERRLSFNGALRVVINQEGKVESVALVQSVIGAYDPLLLAAAKKWTFKPATLNGQPVKFSKIFPVSLSPR